ncbi:MAG: porin family protein [Woeseiaceae bacterium]
MKIFTVALLGLAILCTTSVHADERLSLGASIGYVNIEDDEPGFQFDANDTGYKFFANYTFNNNLAIEGGYIDFGSPEDIVAGLPGEIDASGWNIYGVGNLPLSDSVNLFAKAGVVAWEADSIIDGLLVDTDDGTDLALGFGAGWNTNEAFGIRAEVDWYDIDEADSVWMASVGFEFRF